MMKHLYNIGIACYKQLVAMAGHFNAKAHKLAQGQANVFELLQQHLAPEGGYTWIHASSLGEFEQGRPLIEALKRNNPQRRILLTFFSPSGYEVRKNYSEVDYVCYLPFDQPANARRFIELVKPTEAIFVKYEFWSNYLHELKRKNIPTYIISAIFRPSQLFFRPYGSFFRDMLKCFTHLFVQDEASRALLAGIGIDNVTVAGDTRFDRVMTIRNQAKEYPLIGAFCDNRFIWVAGSSWPEDEALIIQYFNKRPHQKLIIAPHEIDEKHLQQIESRLSRPTIRYSQATQENIRQADCLIIDTFGMLSSIYRYGSMAYIGGGFGAGIHNILEAAVYGIPVVFGPNFKKFREARNMLAAGCAFTISQYQPLEQLMDDLVAHPDKLAAIGKIAGDYFALQAGATDIIYKAIYGNTPQEPHNCIPQ